MKVTHSKGPTSIQQNAGANNSQISGISRPAVPFSNNVVRHYQDLQSRNTTSFQLKPAVVMSAANSIVQLKGEREWLKGRGFTNEQINELNKYTGSLGTLKSLVESANMTVDDIRSLATNKFPTDLLSRITTLGISATDAIWIRRELKNDDGRLRRYLMKNMKTADFTTFQNSQVNFGEIDMLLDRKFTIQHMVNILSQPNNEFTWNEQMELLNGNTPADDIFVPWLMQNAANIGILLHDHGYPVQAIQRLATYGGVDLARIRIIPWNELEPLLAVGGNNNYRNWLMNNLQRILELKAQFPMSADRILYMGQRNFTDDMLIHSTWFKKTPATVQKDFPSQNTGAVKSIYLGHFVTRHTFDYQDFNGLSAANSLFPRGISENTIIGGVFGMFDRLRVANHNHWNEGQFAGKATVNGVEYDVTYMLEKINNGNYRCSQFYPNDGQPGIVAYNMQQMERFRDMPQ